MAPSDIYLIRHAESTWNAAGRWQGQADPPLSPQGEQQAAELAAAFPDVDVTHILTSDLTRTMSTAVPFAARFGLELEVLPDLREIDVGSWSGKTRDEIRAEDPDALDLYFRGRQGWEGGESFEEHEERSARAAAKLTDIETTGVVVAVTHGGTIRAILRTLLELEHGEHRWRISGPGHTSLTHLRLGPHGWRLLAFNAMADLRRT